ncbi:MAG: class I SAM-dependent methyltransferase [Phycisphaerae bacterium]|nr:class I SAM-dependent methyltransferase [Phycisphaerae bacterium]
MRGTHVAVGAGWVLLATELLGAGYIAAATPPARSSVPFVATRHDTVRDLLWLAGVEKNDVVYDLGSGDGRIVLAAVRDFGARRAVGIESDPDRVLESRESAQKAGLTGRVEFIQGDLFMTDFSPASVVTLFLGHQPNIELRPKILSMLKPGTRVLSHQFGMGEWAIDKELTVRMTTPGMWAEMWNPYQDNPCVPDYSANEMHFGTSDKVLMWVVPSPVAGVWTGVVETPDGQRDYRLILHQRLSEVSGTFQLSGVTPLTGGIRAELWGDHVRYEGIPSGIPYGRFQIRFDGHASGDSMKGTLAIADPNRSYEVTWEGQRDKVSLTGQWEWTSATGDRPVRLRVERRDSRSVATYLDRDKQIPVPDFYDFGGGFYFTLLIGREGSSLTIKEDTGWLIGEGVIDQGELKGRMDFYPYPSTGLPRGLDGKRTIRPEVHQDWTPRRIKP